VALTAKLREVFPPVGCVQSSRTRRVAVTSGCRHARNEAARPAPGSTRGWTWSLTWRCPCGRALAASGWQIDEAFQSVERFASRSRPSSACIRPRGTGTAVRSARRASASPGGTTGRRDHDRRCDGAIAVEPVRFSIWPAAGAGMRAGSGAAHRAHTCGARWLKRRHAHGLSLELHGAEIAPTMTTAWRCVLPF